MKKKFLALLLAALMVVSLLPTVAFAAWEGSGKGTAAEPWEIGATTPSDVTAYLEGSTLHIEGTGAMMDFVDKNGRPWHSSANSITTVKIGPNVTKLGVFAFSDCYNVANLYIDSIESWCGITFGNDLSNPFCVSNSSMHLYVGNTEKTELVIPNTITAIPDYAFKNWNMLTRVTIPAGVTSIGKEAFSTCTALESLTLPDGLTTIGQSAFYGCTAFESLTLPDGLTTIGQSAFYGCRDLASINLPDSLTDIGAAAFHNCMELDSITIPRKLSVINTQTFDNCQDLDSVHLPAGLTTIGDYAFSGCYDLKTLIIPQNVTSIGQSATYNTNALKTVVVKATTPPTLGSNNFKGSCPTLIGAG